MNDEPALCETAKKNIKIHCDFVPHISVLGDLCEEYFPPLVAQEQKSHHTINNLARR